MSRRRSGLAAFGFAAIALLGAFACSADEQHGNDGGAGATGAGTPGAGAPNAGGGGTDTGGTATVGAGGAGPNGGSSGSANGGTAGGSGGAAGGGTTAGGAGPRDGGAAGGGAPGPGDGGELPDGGRSLSTDRTKFFGESRCAAAKVQFCEDFESGSLASWKLTGTPTIDGTQKARGQKSLHLKVASGGKIAIETDKVFPEADNTYYGRAFVYFVALPTPVGMTTYAHWTFIAATGDNVSGEIRISGQMSSGINHFGVGTDNRTDANGTGDWTNSDDDPKGQPKAVPVGQWLCIEWMHKGDTNETRFFWDGAEHPSLYTSSSMHGGSNNPYILPKFRRVWLGLQEYQEVRNTDNSLEQYELYLDEIALDHSRIGCVL